MKTIIKILSVLIVIALLGFGAYYFFIVKKTPETADNSIGETISTIFTRRNPTDSNTTIIPNTTNTPTNGTPSTAVESPFTRIDTKSMFRQITNIPVSGYTGFIQEKITEEAIIDPKTKTQKVVQKKIPVEMMRYVVKETGNVFEGEITETLIEQKQKTATDVPKTEFAHFFKQGAMLAYQFLGETGRTIETIWGTFPPENRTFTYCGIPITKELRRGSTGPEVKSLQTFLGNALGQKVTTDGNFGIGTEKLLKTMQQGVFLEETGKTDALTREHIETDCAKKLADFKEELGRPVLLTTQFAPQGIERVSVSPDETQVFYTRKDANGLKGFVTSGGTALPKQIFTSAFSEWMPQWVSKELITMTTYASREAVGYMYGLNPIDGNFVKLFGPVTGLTTNTSPSGEWMLFSESTKTGFITRLINLKTRTGNQLTVPTLPEKCAWLSDSTNILCAVPKQIPGSSYPDNWYKGLVSFADEFWLIQLNPFQTKLLYTPDTAIDFINPVFGPKDTFLYGTDKGTGFLYVLTLE